MIEVNSVNDKQHSVDFDVQSIFSGSGRQAMAAMQLPPSEKISFFLKKLRCKKNNRYSAVCRQDIQRRFNERALIGFIEYLKVSSFSLHSCC